LCLPSVLRKKPLFASHANTETPLSTTLGPVLTNEMALQAANTASMARAMNNETQLHMRLPGDLRNLAYDELLERVQRRSRVPTWRIAQLYSSVQRDFSTLGLLIPQ